MVIKRLATAVAGSTAVAAALAGIATTTAAPANAAPKFSAIAYSPVTGAWGWAMLAGTPRQAQDVAMTHCVGAGGTDCGGSAFSGPGGCVALARRTDGTKWATGAGATPAEAQGRAYGPIGGGDLLVSTCSGTDAEKPEPIGRGGVSPLPAVPPDPIGPPRAIIYPTPPDVDIDNVFGFDPGVAVTVKNPRTIDTHCQYEAVPRPPTGLQNSVREFDIKAKGTANFKINGVPTGTTWDVTVRCKGQVPKVLAHVF